MAISLAIPSGEEGDILLVNYDFCNDFMAAEARGTMLLFTNQPLGEINFLFHFLSFTILIVVSYPDCHKLLLVLFDPSFVQNVRPSLPIYDIVAHLDRARYSNLEFCCPSKVLERNKDLVLYTD